MKNQFMKFREQLKSSIIVLILLLVVVGCQNSQEPGNESEDTSEETGTENTSDLTSEESGESLVEAVIEEQSQDYDGAPALASQALEIRFGYDGEPFVMQLEENETAQRIALEVGTTNWELPIYHFDDFEDSNVMQYYDIPSDYDIPSNPVSVTAEKAGEVYYSDPNRIILFYEDAQVSGEFTKIGTIEYSEAFHEAVVNNPILETWNTKIVSVSPVEE